MKKLSSAILSFGFLLAAQASAFGGFTGGGGDAFLCPMKASSGKRLSANFVYLADSFEAFSRPRKKDGTQASDGRFLSLLPEATLLKISLQTIRSQDPLLAQKIQQTLGRLRFVPKTKLAELDDDALPVKLKGCQKQQLAIQNRVLRVVSFQPELHARLSTLDKVYLKIHESLISLYPHLGDTTPLRKKLRSLLTFERMRTLAREEMRRMPERQLFLNALAMSLENMGFEDFSHYGVPYSAGLKKYTFQDFAPYIYGQRYGHIYNRDLLNKSMRYFLSESGLSASFVPLFELLEFGAKNGWTLSLDKIANYGELFIIGAQFANFSEVYEVLSER